MAFYYPGQGKNDPIYVYIVAHVDADGFSAPVKIGVASDPRKRVLDLQTGNPRKLALVATLATKDRLMAGDIERAAHKVAASYKMEGEWFNLELDDALTATAEAMRKVLMADHRYSNKEAIEIILKTMAQHSAWRAGQIYGDVFECAA